MPQLTEKAQHIVVLMMENRSFDHMLGGLKALNPAIDGLTGNETNPNTKGEPVKVSGDADYQSDLQADPGHHYPDVDIQLFDGQPHNGPPGMQGFVHAYFNKTGDVKKSHNIMKYFTPDQLPVLSTLAQRYAVFNRWFSSIPGPTLCNRAFAHFGTSFGQVSMDVFYYNKKYLSVYERLVNAGHTAKVYYFDAASSSLEVVNLLQEQPQLFGTYHQFLEDC